MSTPLYVIAQEYMQAANKLMDTDLDEQTIADTLEGISGDFEQKAIAVAKFIRNLEAEAAAIINAAKDQMDRGHAVQKRADRMRDYMMGYMTATSITEVSCEYFRIRVKLNPPAVQVTDADAIPIEFQRYIPESYAPDKKAIKEAIQKGQDVPGCMLTRSTTLEIK
jgi:hypothetical protein